MGLNWSEGLSRLGDGLGALAGYKAQQERDAAQRYAEERRDAANRAFQERIITLQQEHGKEMQKGAQEFTAKENQLNRDQQSAQFEMSQTNALKMHEASMGVQRAQLEATIAAREQQVKDSETARQLNVIQLGMQAAANEKNSLVSSMQKEIAELSKNEALKFNPERLEAAQAQIAQRYEDKIVAADEKFQSYFSKASEMVNIELPKTEPEAAAGGEAKTEKKPDPTTAINAIMGSPNFSEMAPADIEYSLREDFGITDPEQLKEVMRKIMGGGKAARPSMSGSAASAAQFAKTGVPLS